MLHGAAAAAVCSPAALLTFPISRERAAELARRTRLLHKHENQIMHSRRCCRLAGWQRMAAIRDFGYRKSVKNFDFGVRGCVYVHTHTFGMRVFIE